MERQEVIAKLNSIISSLKVASNMVEELGVPARQMITERNIVAILEKEAGELVSLAENVKKSHANMSRNL